MCIIPLHYQSFLSAAMYRDTTARYGLGLQTNLHYQINLQMTKVAQNFRGWATQFPDMAMSFQS